MKLAQLLQPLMMALGPLVLLDEAQSAAAHLGFRV